MSRMAVNWETAQLGKVCENLDSKRIPITKSKRINGEVPYYGASGVVDYVAEYIFDEDLLLVSEDGANLLARTYPIAFSVSGKSWVNNHAHVLRFKEMCSQRFIEYYLNSISLEPYVSGMAQPKLNQKSLSSIAVPFPNTEEQKRIVAILDEAFAGIDQAAVNAEKNLANAHELFESYLNSIFTRKGEGWEEKRIGDIAQVKGGKRVPKGYKLLTEPTDFPYLRVTDFTDIGSIDMSDLRYVGIEVHREIKNYVIFSTELYISIAGTIGKSGIIPKELDGANLTENACRLVFKPGISNRFVYYFTLTADFVEQTGLNTRTAAQPKLALSRLSTTRLGIPSLLDQERLADRFEALRFQTQRLETIYREKLAALAELKQSILHKAFSGELTGEN